MKKLKVEKFGTGFMGKSGEEKLVDFINENSIKEENILNIVFKSTIGEYVLFYYVE